MLENTRSTAPAVHPGHPYTVGRTALIAVVGAATLVSLTGAAGAAAPTAPEGRAVWGTSTSRVSVGANKTQANLDSYCCPAISADGRYVAFESDASNLVAGDTNNAQDVFVEDRVTKTIRRISVASDGTQANGSSYTPSISDNGRIVVFASDATNLFPDDTNGVTDVFLYDLDAGFLSIYSISADGDRGNGASYFPAISRDAEAIVFQTDATNLVAGDTNGVTDVIVRDRTGLVTDRVSVSSAEKQADGASTEAVISADGRYVVYGSAATNLVTRDTNGEADLFLRDRTAGTTERVSVGAGGVQGTGSNGRAGLAASVTVDGRYVTFTSYQSNLVADDTNGAADAFVRDRTKGTTIRMSVDAKGAELKRDSFASSASADARQVVFYAHSDRVVRGDRNRLGDVFVRDVKAQRTQLVSIGAAGSADRDSGGGEITPDGVHIAFWSDATNLVAGDTNGVADIFVRDRA